MENLSGIYEIVNTVNGKRYIGSAKNFKTRWNKHRSALRLDKHGNRHLQGAWNKHGEAEFKFLQILTCQPSMLLFYEQQLIDKVKPEYNIAPTAGNTLGIPCGDEKRQKIADAHKGKVLTAEHRAAIAAGGTGRSPTEATRSKLRETMKAYVAANPAFAEQSAERQRNRVWTEESRAKLRAFRTGRASPKSPEGKERQRLAAIKSNQTRAISAETREKMAAKKRGKVMHANTLALQTNRMKGNSLRLGAKWTPEMREKILASRAATNLRKKQGGAG